LTEKEDVALEVLLDFLDAVEAGIASARHRIGNVKQVSPLPDFDLMFWETKQGTKGTYQQTNKDNNKVESFSRLAAELKDHNGFWQYKGCRYWFHQNNENVIDRRKI